MTFNERITRFQAILNRDDCTNDAATIYLQDAMARVVREARLPNMERSVIVTVQDQPATFIAIPPDLIAVIDIFVADGKRPDTRALVQLSQRQLFQRCPTDLPDAYSRFQGQFNFAGSVPKGGTITLWYYGEFSDFASFDSENEISASNPDLVIYGALSFAADVFSHPSAQQWEARYQQILEQVQMLATDLDTMGGPLLISPMYTE